MIATLSPTETLMLTPARAVTVPNRLTISLVVISGVLMSLISSSSRRDSDSARTAVEVVLGIPLGQPIPGLPAQVDRTRYLGSVQLRFSPRWSGRARPTHEAVAARRIAELTASRREIVAAYEIERRRIERRRSATSRRRAHEARRGAALPSRYRGSRTRRSSGRGEVGHCRRARVAAHHGARYPPPGAHRPRPGSGSHRRESTGLAGPSGSFARTLCRRCPRASWLPLTSSLWRR